MKAYWHGQRFAGDGSAAFDHAAEERARERRALILTIAMHLLLVLFIIISIDWKNKEPEAMQAEIWTPQQLAAATAAAQREAQTFGDPAPKPEPELPKPQPEPPKPEPKPTPKPEPKPQPKPEPAPPKPQPKPEPAKTPANPKADIAIKQEKKTEKDPKSKDVKDDKKQDDKKKPDTKDTKDDKKKPDPKDNRKKAQDDFLEELKREEQKLAAQKQQAAQRQQAAATADARAQREAAMRAQAGAEAKAAGAERAKGDDRSYLSKLKTKIRGNVILPPNVQGNPAAVFRVTQLPSGEVIDVRLIKSSGNQQLDTAVERAIRKSSPLPVPEGRSPDRVIDITYLPFEKPPT